MTPFVEAARQLVHGLRWAECPTRVLHENRALVWRHHGLGMLQAELSETLRIHIWHPELVSSGMAWPRCVHDHRFDITSAVVVGSIIDVPHTVRLDVETRGTWAEARAASWQAIRVYSIKHAKEQDRAIVNGGTTAISAKCLGSGRVDRLLETRHGAGTWYVIGRREFHTTLIDELAITVVHRSNFDDRLARVLCAPDSDVTAVSGIVRDESLEHRILINWVLREASDAIANMKGTP